MARSRGLGDVYKRQLIEKIKAARLYYREVVAEFDRTHRQIGAVTIDAPAQPAPKPIAPAEIPASIF
jgi:hypothetical protein